MVAFDAVRKPIEGFGPVFDIRQQVRRNLLVIGYHVAFGVPLLRPEHFV
jgi:hypothetical protein